MKKRMSRRRRMARERRRNLAASVTAAVVAASWMMPTAFAEPVPGEVPVLDGIRSGHADISTVADGEHGQKMTVDQTGAAGTHNVAIDWKSFNVGGDSTVYFKQASGDVALNRVTGENPSDIFGRLQSDGRVILINPHGILFGFGPTAQLDVGSIVASTAKVDMDDKEHQMEQFASTGKFSGVIDPASTASIINEGTIHADSGLIVFHAAKIENAATGTINESIQNGDLAHNHESKARADAGYVDSVEMVALSPIEYGPDKISFDIAPSKLVAAGIENKGEIYAWNGHVIMTAHAADDLTASIVNDTEARVQARAIATDADGSIELTSGGGIGNKGYFVGDDTAMTAGSDIENAGYITGTALTMTAGGDIINRTDGDVESHYEWGNTPDGTSYKMLYPMNLVASGRIVNEENARFVSNCDLVATAGSDLVNDGSLSGRKPVLTAGRDIINGEHGSLDGGYGSFPDIPTKGGDTDLIVKAGRDIANEGVSSSYTALQLDAAGDITNGRKGRIGSEGLFSSDSWLGQPYDVRLKAGRDIVNDGTISATNGEFYEVNWVQSATGSIVDTDIEYRFYDVKTRVSLEAQNIKNRGSGVIGGSNFFSQGTELSLKATTGDIENSGVIYVASELGQEETDGNGVYQRRLYFEGFHTDLLFSGDDLSRKKDAGTELTLSTENGAVKNGAGWLEGSDTEWGTDLIDLWMKPEAGNPDLSTATTLDIKAKSVENDGSVRSNVGSARIVATEGDVVNRSTATADTPAAVRRVTVEDTLDDSDFALPGRIELAGGGNLSVEAAGDIRNEKDIKADLGNLALTAGKDVVGAGSLMTGTAADGTHTGGGTVSVTATGDIDLGAVTAGGKVLVRSTGGTGVATADDGSKTVDGSRNTLRKAIKTDSAEKAAVVVATNGLFDNQAGAGIFLTGTGGTWNVYSATPVGADFGGLSSDHLAQWQTAYGTDGQAYEGNKFIFQDSPVIEGVIRDAHKEYGTPWSTENNENHIDYRYADDTLSQGIKDGTLSTAFTDSKELNDHRLSDLKVTSRGYDAAASRTEGDRSTVAPYLDTYDVTGIDGTASVSDGYTFRAVSGSVIIDPKKISYTTTGTATTTYGDKPTYGGITTKPVGVLEGDELKNQKTTYTSTEGYNEETGRTNHVGTYGVESHITFDNPDYELTKVEENGHLTVTPADLIVKVDDKTATAGDSVTLTGQVTGLKNGDTEQGLGIIYRSDGLENGIARMAGEGPLDYGIDGSILRGGEYKVTIDNGTLRVSPPTPQPANTYHPEIVAPTTVKGGGSVVTVPGKQEATQPSGETAERPDFDARRPDALTTQNLEGTGEVSDETVSSRGIPGIDSVAGLADTELPFFRVASGRVSDYGTYFVAAEPEQVKLTPTVKRLPEPDGVGNQYREYTTDLAGQTPGTEGSFRISYNGVVLNVTPEYKSAVDILRRDDKDNNVTVAAEALHTAFNDMGLVLEDLDGVYIHPDR